MRALSATVVLCLACAAEPVTRGDPVAFDLVGTWYVQVLDEGAVTAEDAVWRFARDGGRIRWTLFASPIHEGEGIDFGAGRPAAAQVAETAAGLVVTRRNAIEKTLDGSDASGWTSSAGSRPSSASALTFARRLGIDGLPDRPVFTRVETLGGVGAEALAGTVRFVAREVEPDRLAGDYERDGERVGRFAMWRIGSVRVRE